MASTAADKFTTTFNALLELTGYTVGQLARRSGLPKTTLTNWRSGRVVRPRHRLDLLKLAQAMRLSAEEADRLLQAADQPALETLLRQSKPEEHPFLSAWKQTPHSPTPLFLLPPRLSHFVGRVPELDRLQTTIQTPGQPPIMISGLAGSGKSSLALELGYRSRPYFADGVVWQAVGGRPLDQVLYLLGQALGWEMGDIVGIPARSQLVRRLYSQRHLLLILDDVISREQVLPLLPASGSCQVVLTCRQAEVLRLEGAYELSLGGLEPEEGAALAKYLAPDLPSTPRWPQLKRLFARFDHHPLTLVLLTGWIAGSVLPAEPDISSLGRDGADLVALIQQSLATVGERGLRVLRLVAWQRDETIAVRRLLRMVNQSPSGLDATLALLRQRFLVNVWPDGRIGLHPVVRDVIAAEGLPLELAEASYAAWVDFVLDNQARPDVLAGEEENWRGALRWGWAHAEKETAVAATLAAANYLLLRGTLDELAEWLDRAEENADGATLGQIALLRGRIALEKRALETASQHFERALHLSRHSPPYLRAAALIELGVTALCLGDLQAGERYFAMGLPLANSYPDLRMTIEGERGTAAALEGRFTDAQAHLSQALELAQGVPYTRRLSMLHVSLSGVALLCGALEEAEVWLERATRVAEAGRDQKGWLFINANRAALAYARGEMAQASGDLQAALAIAHLLPDEMPLQFLQGNLERLEAGAPRLQVYV